MTTDQTATGETPLERHASWLELFFDLLFVAIVSQLAHSLVGRVTAGQVLAVIGLFCPLWWLWVSFSYFSDTEERDTPGHRIGVLVIMACLVVTGGGVAGALHGDPALFALGIGLARLTSTLLWALTVSHRFGRRATTRTAAPYLVAAAAWLFSAALPAPACYPVWAAALLLEAVPALRAPRGATATVRATIDGPHLVERFGLFVIIVLGEGIVQIVAALGSTGHAGAPTVLTGLAAFVLLAAVWWLYFDFGSEASLALLKARPSDVWPLLRDGFALGHLLLVGGIVALSAGLGAAVTAAKAGGAHPETVRMVCAALLVYLLNNAVVGVTLGMSSVRKTAAWLLPDAAAVGTVWAAATRLAPGWAFLLLAAALLLTALPSVLRRWRTPGVPDHSATVPG
ncbi:low temperature requirement protein A [Streptomyces sp. NPDC059104]|uniref:low temperature requirement protein A n=1 Tax=Streptomyces sp. NPDC059104 TaxID=3346729 RepID=UPI0036A45EC0